VKETKENRKYIQKPLRSGGARGFLKLGIRGKTRGSERTGKRGGSRGGPVGELRRGGKDNSPLITSLKTKTKQKKWRFGIGCMGKLPQGGPKSKDYLIQIYSGKFAKEQYSSGPKGGR